MKMAFRTQQRQNSKDTDTSLEQLDSSVEMLSPSPGCSLPTRKLHFLTPPSTTTKAGEDVPTGKPVEQNNDIEMANLQNAQQNAPEFSSPPYRKVRALRLLDTPATPKTILESSHMKMRRNELMRTVERSRAVQINNPPMDCVKNKAANVNPFTPDNLMARNRKRARTKYASAKQFGKGSGFAPLNASDDDNGIFHAGTVDKNDFNETDPPPKRLALQETNISRYQKEFVEVSMVGIGEFGLVYQCLNRLDGCVYAIKKSIKPIAGSFFEKRALNEVWAHAVLGKHDNVVRYYSAWAEDSHMLIQNEYCNGGSLQAVIQNRALSEAELKILLLHVAEGLRYIHSNDLVHMDLKPGNIFIARVPPFKKPLSNSQPMDTGAVTMESEEATDGLAGLGEDSNDYVTNVTYKIGDLGHVTSMSNPSNPEDGDSRYLPNEILQDDYGNLDRADIFSLGLTLYEAGGGGPLPKNGPKWHELRQGLTPKLSGLSNEFNDLIKLMTHPDPTQRPSSTTIFDHPILNSVEAKSKTQLCQELAMEKCKNEILQKKLRDLTRLLKKYKSSAMSFESRSLRSMTRKNLNPLLDIADSDDAREDARDDARDAADSANDVEDLDAQAK